MNAKTHSSTLAELLSSLDTSKLNTVNWRTSESSFEDRRHGGHLAAEEAAEFIQRIIKYYDRKQSDKNLDYLCEETADLILLIDQLVRTLPADLMLDWLNVKVNRTISRYHNKKEGDE